MKKVILMAGAVLMSAVCLGQVSNVKKAQNLVLSETPNYDEARKLIEAALQNPETKDMANTWYVAGLIGYQQSENEFNKRFFNQQVDFNVMGAAEKESYLYWQKADELAQILVQDKKGNMVMDKKNAAIRKNIATKMIDYWTNQGLLGYAGSFYENKDYAGTYELYKMYIDIPDLPVMQDPKIQDKMVRDTIYQDLCHSAGMLAYSAEKYEECVAIFSKLVRGDYKAVNAGEYLYSSYLMMKDTVKAYEMMDLCVELFPNEPRILQTRIDAYMAEKEYDKALGILEKAMAIENQVQYYNSKGSILTELGRYDEALQVYEEALKVFPDNAEIYEFYGYVYSTKGSRIDDDLAYTSGKMTNADYNKAVKERDDSYKKAIPLFEKSLELDKDNTDCVRILRSLYYRLRMMDKYNSL